MLYSIPPHLSTLTYVYADRNTDELSLFWKTKAFQLERHGQRET